MEFKTSISVKYKMRDGWHVFFSDDLPGLYVASKKVEVACNDIAPSIQKLIELDTGSKVEVMPEPAFAEFLREVQEKSRTAPKGRKRLTRSELLEFQQRQQQALVASEKRYSIRLR